MLQMLRELPPRELAGEPRRRWFFDDYFDLIVWLDPDSSILGFQLCYETGGHERALTWTKEHGFRHDRVDDGEPNPAKNRAPILVPDGVFPADVISGLFTSQSQEIDQEIRSFVLGKLSGYSEHWRDGTTSKRS